jgi:hypothetical protein
MPRSLLRVGAPPPFHLLDQVGVKAKIIMPKE